VRAWLDEPSRDLRGIWFLPISHQDDLGKVAAQESATEATDERSRP
jgi:hypothetical protein